MREKTVLIYWPSNRLVPVGGPSGYLYNLELGLKQINERGCDFLPAVQDNNIIVNWLKRNVPRRIREFRWLHNNLSILRADPRPSVDFNEYRIVHFHTTIDLYINRKNLEGYKGTVLLTSHSPCALHKELIDDLNPKDVARHKERLSQLEQVDEFSFGRANYIIFPCREAEEPYRHSWDKYDLLRNEDKILYLPTGIAPCSASVGRDTIRNKYCIPQDAFVLTYIGRHNDVKGYTDFLALAPRLLEDENVWVLNAGREEPFGGYKHRRWVEVGWTDDPHSIAAAADLFILPNRETYFDLILLEMLSLGQLVLARRTGGNKLFERLHSSGIRLYGDDDEFFELLNSVKLMSSDERREEAEHNRAFYEQYFTCKAFANRYCRLLESIDE